MLIRIGHMDDHYERCEGISCRCMDTAYKSRRKRTRPGDKPLSMSGEEYEAKLWRETDISLREHPERQTPQRVSETKHHQMSPLGERMRAGRSG